MITRQDFHEFLRQSASDLEQIECVRAHSRALTRLAERVHSPFTVAIAGRMKAGKSTLLNALVGQTVAVCGTEESTATINVIQHGATDQLQHFVVHWKDGRSEPMPRSRISEWVGKSPDVVERVRQVSRLEFFAAVEALRKFRIVDTPGTGSAEDAHEETARQFLDPEAIRASLAENEKADAFIYVVPTIGRESDRATLQQLGQSRIPGADAYNSVCVVHKWDGLDSADPFDEAERKAAQLHAQLDGAVAETMAVSAPLALAAAEAPDAFWERLLAVLAGTEAVALERCLKTRDRWEREPARRAILDLYPALPWVSFVLLAKRLTRETPASGADARRLARQLSGIERLTALIERRFFRRAELLKLFQLLVLASKELLPAALALNRHVATLRQQLAAATQAQGCLGAFAPAPVRQWIDGVVRDLTAEIERCNRLALGFDRRRLAWSAQVEGLHLDLRTLDWLQGPSHGLKPDEHCIACAACMMAEPDSHGIWDTTPLPELGRWIDAFRGKSHTCARALQPGLEHITARLEEIYHRLLARS
ncbi:dynamin family protein [Opitutus sp. ER46]|uniref:dynamin family protein n=1 Tax=Opitutus sp. ER46 TaxID=2161864 RepID=UPI000D2F708F|nr:dynamin family protein [Opitutus sp. ER46]PTX91196.1 hypothetical protein DB354_21430 [Opitutus sp. ER46]